MCCCCCCFYFWLFCCRYCFSFFYCCCFFIAAGSDASDSVADTCTTSTAVADVADTSALMLFTIAPIARTNYTACRYILLTQSRIPLLPHQQLSLFSPPPPPQKTQDVDPMLGNRRRWWPSIGSTSGLFYTCSRTFFSVTLAWSHNTLNNKLVAYQ